MTQTIVNLALPAIEAKVEEVLDRYPASPYRSLLTARTSRKELVAYVLKRMPKIYATAEENQACSIEAPISCFSQEQQNRMHELIHEGIQYLLNRRAEAQGSAPGGNSSASHWFG